MKFIGRLSRNQSRCLEGVYEGLTLEYMEKLVTGPGGLLARGLRSTQPEDCLDNKGLAALAGVLNDYVNPPLLRIRQVSFGSRCCPREGYSDSTVFSSKSSKLLSSLSCEFVYVVFFTLKRYSFPTLNGLEFLR